MSEFEGVGNILEMLRTVYAVDFDHYKPGTIRRRIERRIALCNLQDVHEYVDYLAVNPEELELLYQDLLIGVTRFYRDAEAFEVLSQKVLPELLTRVAGDQELRCWVPACASGEEAYSLAIALSEAARLLDLQRPVRIFASDLHAGSLRQAADGRYAKGLLQDLPEELRERYFHREASGLWRVDGSLRRMLIFSPHNLLKDPPFTRMDLISCRNLLIYLQPRAQNRTLTTFHFALREGGVLFLGPSESLGEIENEFGTIDRHWRIFRKLRNVRLSHELRPLERSTPAAAAHPQVARAYEQLLNLFVPTGVLINERREVLHTFGEAERYLRPARGRVSSDLVAMTRDDLRVAVSAAVQTVQRNGDSVHIPGIHLIVEGEEMLVDVMAESLRDGFILVRFLEDRPATEPSLRFELSEPTRQHIEDLENELQQTKLFLQSATEELETRNEELQASNEELLAANEELQSTNEELHSVNEELYSVNADYEQKIRELDASTSDLKNLLEATAIGTIFTDLEHRIRLFTPAAARILNLLPADLGRDIKHITSRFPQDDLFQDLDRVSRQGEPRVRNLALEDGSVWLRTVKPYVDVNRRVQGLVITFVDVTRLVTVEQELRQIIESLPQLVWTYSPGGDFELVGQNWEDYPRRPWWEGIHPQDRQRVTEHWQAVLASGSEFRGEFRLLRGDGEFRWFDGRCLPLRDAAGQISKWFGCNSDVTERRDASERLESAFYHGAPCGYFSLDESGRFLRVNDTLCHWMGRERSELVGSHLGEVRQEMQFVRADGTRFWGWVNGHDGLFSVVDITPRKEAEQALHSREERTRYWLNQTTDGTWEWHVASGETYLSARWRELLGLSAEAEVNWRDLLHHDDVPLMERAVERHLEAREPMVVPLRYRHADGSWVWVICRGVYLPEEGRMVGTHTDITALKAAEAEIVRLNQDLEARVQARTLELVESEERFRRLANDSPVLIWMSNAQGQPYFFNETWLRFTGSRFWPQQLQDLEAARKPFELELQLPRSDGGEGWVLCSAAPRWREDGTFLGFVGCAQDITQRKELARLEEKLHETTRLESLGLLAGGIAHDFNNILTSILGNVSLARLDPSSSDLPEMLEEIYQSSERARDVCNQMLAYSGRGRFQVGRIPLNELLEETLPLLRASLSKSSEFVIHLCEESSLIEGDRGQLRQVITNLLVNAAESLGPGGGSVRARTFREEDRVCLEVVDTGCGIAQENLPRIFDPFFTTKFMGRGLGLAAVQGIVRSHQGSIAVQSDLGRGTRICVWFPAVEKREVGARVEPRQSGDWVLVVDDEKPIRSLVVKILTHSGMKCMIAENGDEALDLFRERGDEIGLVLLDLNMPNRDGASTFQELRKMAPGLKVVVMSGYDEQEISEEWVMEGPSGFLQKPFETQALLATVRAHWNG